ncbi:MAG: hypothetical protein JWN24_3778, partial [Phycisphaerales bacterium]|nr:hypothetical protein [Phycisphaerales bacterium]
MTPMSRPLIKLSDFHTPIVYASVSGLFGVLFVLWQIVNVAPYPNEKR